MRAIYFRKSLQLLRRRLFWVFKKSACSWISVSIWERSLLAATLDFLMMSSMAVLSFSICWGARNWTQ